MTLYDISESWKSRRLGSTYLSNYLFFHFQDTSGLNVSLDSKPPVCFFLAPATVPLEGETVNRWNLLDSDEKPHWPPLGSLER